MVLLPEAGNPTRIMAKPCDLAAIELSFGYNSEFWNIPAMCDAIGHLVFGITSSDVQRDMIGVTVAVEHLLLLSNKEFMEVDESINLMLYESIGEEGSKFNWLGYLGLDGPSKNSNDTDLDIIWCSRCSGSFWA